MAQRNFGSSTFTSIDHLNMSPVSAEINRCQQTRRSTANDQTIQRFGSRAHSRRQTAFRIFARFDEAPFGDASIRDARAFGLREPTVGRSTARLRLRISIKLMTFSGGGFFGRLLGQFGMLLF